MRLILLWVFFPFRLKLANETGVGVAFAYAKPKSLVMRTLSASKVASALSNIFLPVDMLVLIGLLWILQPGFRPKRIGTKSKRF